jgi:hypothetical protein
VLQIDVETGAMFSVKVGADNTQMGLMSLYSDERDRLESIGHPYVAAVRRLMSWFMEKCMQYSVVIKFAYFSTAHIVTLRGFRLTFTSV